MFNSRRFSTALAGGMTAAAVAVTSATVVPFGAVATAQTPSDQVKFSITNFTDFHGHLSHTDNAKDPKNTELGAAELAHLMDSVKASDEEQIRTSTGDNVGGSAFVSSITNDEYTIKALNAMHMDVSAVGNHEFDKGQDDLYNRIQKESTFPILGANVINRSTGQPVLKPSTVIEKNGVKVGIVGTVTQNTVQKVAPSAIEGLDFTDPTDAANKEADRLKSSKEADVVIVLQHEDIQAFRNFDSNVDFAFGGDSHLRYEGDPYAQSQEYGKMLSEIEFTYDKTAGKISSHQFKFWDATKLPDGMVNPTKDKPNDPNAVNPEVKSIVDEAEAKAAVEGNKEVATIDNDYLRGSNPGDVVGSNRGVESTANNMIAEANRWSMNNFMKQGDNFIDLGLMNAGGVRADLHKGTVTYADAMTVQPFGNVLSYATLPGQTIIDALEKQWKKPTDDRPRLSLGVSNNVSYSYNPNAADGQRINTVYVNGKPIDPEADYKVAASSFLFQGGDGFIDPAQVKDYKDVGYLDITAFTDYLAAAGKPELRSGQGEIGIDGFQNLAAGEEATLNLSSLNYSTNGEPMAKTVTVTVGDQTATADIDSTLYDKDKGYGENGRAQVKLVMPKKPGNYDLVVATDAGAKIAVPVIVKSKGQTKHSDIDGETPGKAGTHSPVFGAPLPPTAPRIAITKVPAGSGRMQ